MYIRNVQNNENIVNAIIASEKELKNFDSKKYGTSARQDLVEDISELKIKLANKIIEKGK